MAFQVTYLIYASVGRSVYLDDIKVFALGYCSAGFTFTARLTVRRAILAVQSFCDRRAADVLPHPLVPKRDKRGQTSFFQRFAQDAHGRALSDHVRKFLGSVSAI
jgi:hypothetical protein